MTTPALRRKARHYAMQALYQWQLTQLETDTIAVQFKADNDMSHVDVDYFEELLTECVRRREELDVEFESYLQDRVLKELDPITWALLRIATYELIHRIDVPFKVIVSEAVSLAKKFGATDSHKFINGVLDKLAAKARAVEVQAGSS